jgi:hypothetical protein
MKTKTVNFREYDAALAALSQIHVAPGCVASAEILEWFGRQSRFGDWRFANASIRGGAVSLCFNDDTGRLIVCNRDDRPGRFAMRLRGAHRDLDLRVTSASTDRARVETRRAGEMSVTNSTMRTREFIRRFVG